MLEKPAAGVNVRVPSALLVRVPWLLGGRVNPPSFVWPADGSLAPTFSTAGRVPGMAKVSAALARYDSAGGLYISILTNPTMGGVAASWALQGDITLAEPKAMIGFAGRRVISNTVRVELPENFQTSEFLLKHGFVDRVVHRRDLRTEVARIVDYCQIG